MLALAVMFSACNSDAFLEGNATEKVTTGEQGVSIISKANEWYVVVPRAGTITVQDNKKEYTFFYGQAGTYSIGKQSGFTGQVKLFNWAPVYYLYVTYPASFGGNVQVRQEGLGNWNDYGSSPDGKKTIVLTNMQLERGKLGAGPVSVQVISGGHGFYGTEVPWNGAEDLYVELTAADYTCLLSHNLGCGGVCPGCGYEFECPGCETCNPVVGKTPAEWVADIEAALAALVGSGNILDVVQSNPGNSTVINVTIGDDTFAFIGGNSLQSDKYCTIDGVTYQINIYGNPRQYRVLVV